MITQIRQIEQPFPFLEIKNLYNDEELKLIWQELEFLNCLNKLEPPENTGTAVDEKSKVPLKKNVGLFLDDIYTKRNLSNILTVNPKIFSRQIVDAFSELSFAYKIINSTNVDKTLISYYENGGYYKPHEDKSLFTAVTWFFKEPKAFTGGDLYFTDYNVQVEIENNMSVIFPSFVKHAVDKIILKDKDLIGYGRYAMTQFLYSSVED
jgi:2OG-Fe(II) oxygenase superfamily